MRPALGRADVLEARRADGRGRLGAASAAALGERGHGRQNQNQGCGEAMEAVAVKHARKFIPPSRAAHLAGFPGV